MTFAIFYFLFYVAHLFHRGAINGTLKTDKKQIDFFHSVLTAIRVGLFLGMFQPVSEKEKKWMANNGA